jgi:dephospho-CoA kinase
MLLVGLTGNIGAGKSTVAGMLTARGAAIIDSDVLARRAVRAGMPAHRAIVERWGASVTTPDGEIDRAALRERVFQDPDELEALNHIVHPEILRMRRSSIADAEEGGARIVICDIPLLFESNLAGDFDLLVLVDAPRPVRLERLVRERGLRETDAMNMIAAQMPAELKRARADIIVDNTGSLVGLEQRVRQVWDTLVLEERRRASGAVHRVP